ncbi:uncharacterized protein LOC112045204 [Bicyclus anynana]|uniref:Uncharacterized protein LOC112045204 n=1 Tax=Bicyclus anynana TaxID=110368 RepID=A0A6J1MVU3_BICAN|nr:uncharacterized protein LOC112045204 [Bicyclus anynana]
MTEKESVKMFDDLIDRQVLISLVKERPVLWNRLDDVYKDKIGKVTAWTEICVSLKDDFEQMEENDRDVFEQCVIKRWKQIRDAWMKSLLIANKSRKSGIGKPTKPYKYDNELAFMRPIVRHAQNDMRNNEIEEEKERALKRHLDTLSKKRKKQTLIKIANRVDHQLKRIPTENDDRNLTFFKSVLPSLNLFDDDQTLEFQSGVIKLIQNIKRRVHCSWSESDNIIYQNQFINQGYDRLCSAQSPSAASTSTQSDAPSVLLFCSDGNDDTASIKLESYSETD